MAGFTYFDADGDGRITLAELIDKPNPAFTLLDSNHDCVITPEERRGSNVNTPGKRKRGSKTLPPGQVVEAASGDRISRAKFRRIARTRYVFPLTYAREEADFSASVPMAIVSSRLVISAVLIAAIPAGIALAQAPAMFHRDRPSADTIARLQEGRIAMAKAALKLSDSQLKLWAPLEEQIRAAIADRAKARAEREQARQAAPSIDLAERLELRSQAMTQRAERMKVFTAAFKTLYASLTDEQKPLAGLVLRAIGGHHHHHRRFSHDEQQ